MSFNFKNGFSFGQQPPSSGSALPEYAPPVTDFTLAFDAELALDAGISAGERVDNILDMAGLMTLVDNAPASSGDTFLRSGGANSQHYWEFSASTGGFLHSDAVSPSAVLGGGDFTMVFIVDAGINTSVRNDIGWCESSVAFTSPPNADKQTGLFYKANESYICSEGRTWFNETFMSMSSNTPAILAVRNDSTDGAAGYKSYKNNLLIGSKAGVTLANTLDRFRCQGDNQTGGKFYALSMWDRRLDDTEFGDLMSFYGTRYGITIS